MEKEGASLDRFLERKKRFLITRSRSLPDREV